MSAPFFATCSKGLESALATELSRLGCEGVEPASGGVSFGGSLQGAYVALLWSRVASRILAVLHSFDADTADALYSGVRQVDWLEQLERGSTIAVNFVGQAKAVDNTLYGAQRVKDAIVDQVRERVGARPSVDKDDPGVQVYVHGAGEAIGICVDLAGTPMHRRGYRKEGVRAPLRETLAGGLLTLAGWPDAAKELGMAFCDPMCGSGTFVVEAALMAADVAPGLMRGTLGSPHWTGHDHGLWTELMDQARARDLRTHEPAAATIIGRDRDMAAVRVAEANARRAGVSSWVHIEHGALHDAVAPAKRGVLLVNPPYGERLGERTSLERLYLELGDVLKSAFGGWRAGVLSSERRLGQAVGLKAEEQFSVFNGPLRCRLMLYPLQARKKAPGGSDDPLRRVQRLLVTDEAQALANRLRKNHRHIGKWARRNNVSCYRVYDADLPEFASAIDRYEDALVIQEYSPPKEIDLNKADDRLHDTVIVASELLSIDPERVFIKVRRRQRGSEQYERHDEQRQRMEVREGGRRFWVNLSDYLDTGLFLHHRQTRQLVGELASKQTFLNLFCYTASATVHAAAGGASSSLSVDLSNTYVDWARDNLRLNNQDLRQHEVLQSDCLAWIEEEGRRGGRRYDVIFCDPPTFSNSKRMQRTLDIQRDHAELIHSVARLLTPEGQLIFSTNKRRFNLDQEGLAGLKLSDLTEKTTPEDFRRKPLHRCWRIRR